MTDLQQAVAVSGGIFVVIMATQYGDREVTWHTFVVPLVSLVGLGWYYLHGAPTAAVDWVVYGVGASTGVLAGLAAAAVTGVHRRPDGAARTVCGPAFALVWSSVVALRIAFVALAEHDDAFRTHLGTFMAGHHIVEAAIAPFFVLMAIVMVATRIGVVGLRLRSLPAPRSAPTDGVTVTV